MFDGGAGATLQPMTFDPNLATQVVNGCQVQRRTDVGPSERCYVVTTGVHTGYIQVFPDGSAGYWKKLGEVAKPAVSFEDALTKVFTINISGTAGLKLSGIGKLTGRLDGEESKSEEPE